MRAIVIALALSTCAGCGSALVVEPGHRALFFDTKNKVLRHDPLGPGRYRLGMYERLDDFDVTYSTRKETVRTTSAEGLQLDLRLAVIYRPIVDELYLLDTEIGQNYYDEVVGPEFRSAARGVFARHSYVDLQKHNEKIEDEIEHDLQRRIKGKHIEISSITMEAVEYAPEIAAAVRAKLVGEQEAARQKAAIENDALKEKLSLSLQAEQDKLKAEALVREKQNERLIAEEDAKLEKARAEASLTHAKVEAETRTLLAKAAAEEKKAEAKSITWLEVQMHAYDALGKLGGAGTHILIGDWGKLPNFLFPPGLLHGGAAGGGDPYGPTGFSSKPGAKGSTMPIALPSDLVPR
jgi:regulator of protease activity HflC (stomatin/prohibitin superfamily)